MKHLGKRKLAKPTMNGLGKGYIDDAADALAVAICHVIKSTKDEGLNTKAKHAIGH